MTPEQVLAIKPKVLTQAQREAYFNDGFLLVERAISEVMAKLKTPVKLPPKPAPPVKTINSRQTSKATEQGNN